MRAVTSSASKGLQISRGARPGINKDIAVGAAPSVAIVLQGPAHDGLRESRFCYKLRILFYVDAASFRG